MPRNIYLIAGEPSGDLLGAKLMKALKAESSETIAFHGIGGERMRQQGLRSLFPMRDIALMGIAEILPHLPRLLARIRETVADIRARKPGLVVTIDSPGFNFRVAKKLQGEGIPLVHYVAPSVWAYKPERALKVASLYHHLLALLPIEPPYFEQVGLDTTFVGHPAVEDPPHGDAPSFRIRHGIRGDVPLLLMLPGSRRGELTRHLPLFQETVQRLHAAHPDLRFAMPVPDDLLIEVREKVTPWGMPIAVVGSDEKGDAMSAADAALAKSGTVSFELALAGVPMVVVYKVHPFTAMLARRWLKTPYVSLVNILLNQPVIPEFLQESATPETVGNALEALLTDTSIAAKQREAFTQVAHLLGQGDAMPPSRRAARTLLALEATHAAPIA